MRRRRAAVEERLTSVARVKVKKHHGFDPEGYEYVSTDYHIYCDRCGSFRISSHLSPEKSVLLVAAIAAAGWRWYDIGTAHVSGLGWLGWFAPSGLLALLVLHEAWTHLGHKCRRCGNTRISRRDVLHYGASAGWPCDVPEDRIHRHKLISDEPLMQVVVVFFLLPVLLVPAFVAFLMLLLAGAASQAYSNLRKRRRRTRS
jgi:hypothetical protein